MRTRHLLLTFFVSTLLIACIPTPRPDVMTANSFKAAINPNAPTYTVNVNGANKNRGYKLGNINDYYKNARIAVGNSLASAGIGQIADTGKYVLNADIVRFDIVERGYSVAMVATVDLEITWTLRDNAGSLLWEETIHTSQSLGSGMNQIKAEQSCIESATRMNIDSMISKLRQLDL